MQDLCNTIKNQTMSVEEEMQAKGIENIFNKVSIS
jgi:hypothetical protein